MCICICICVYVIVFVSTLDICNPNQVERGVRHLQAALGIEQTGVVGSRGPHVQAIRRGECVSKSHGQPVVFPTSGRPSGNLGNARKKSIFLM